MLGAIAVILVCVLFAYDMLQQGLNVKEDSLSNVSQTTYFILALIFLIPAVWIVILIV